MQYRYITYDRNKNGTYVLYIITAYHNKKPSIEIIADNIGTYMEVAYIRMHIRPAIERNDISW